MIKNIICNSLIIVIVFHKIWKIYNIVHFGWINAKIQHENKLCILNCLELMLLHNIRNIKM